MAIINRHGKASTVFVNGFDMTPILNQADWDHTADTADVTTFGDNDINYLAGLRTGTVNLSGLWSDDGTGAGSTAHLDGVFDDVLGSSTDITLTIGPGGGTAVGDPALLAALVETQRAASSPVSGAVTTNVVGTIDGPNLFGAWAAPVVARSSNAVEINLGAVDLHGSTTAQTGYVAHLHTIAGTTSASITGSTAELVTTLQDSSDSVTWVDLPTQFAALSSTNLVTSQRVLNAGLVCQDRVRVQYVQDSTTLTWGVAMARIP